jgi:hypothetical protein
MTNSFDLHVRFQALTALLLDCAQLWRPVPFYLQVLPWESKFPCLATALRELNDETLLTLETDNAALLDWLTEFLPDTHRITTLQQIPGQTPTRYDYPSRFNRDIPGRKWQQITAFVGCISHLNGPTVDWCAGKGHLGRALYQRFRTPITGLEWNDELCHKGNRLSDVHKVDVRLQHCDVMSPAADSHVHAADHIVALHACGDLHRRLIETASEHRIHSLHLSPCCYHLSSDAVYQPFSNTGRISGLSLSRDDCRLAVQETVTAAAVIAKKRNKKNAWRLGFDSLQRQLRAKDEYLPVPPISDESLKGTFSDFCRRAARLKSLQLPPEIDWPRFEKIGWKRQAEVCRMELPRHAFRRVLELWLALDRTLYLQESGYCVRLSTFCERELSPRNLLISASRPTQITP